MSTCSLKRTAGNTSIDQNSSIEEESSKKLKMNESKEEISIMLLDGGINYIDQPSQLKRDLDKINVNNVIKEAKITVSKHLVITFYNESGRELFMTNKNKIFINEIKIIDLSLNKKKKHEIVIKGLNFKTYENYAFQLATMKIIKLTQMNKSNENYRMVKAECENEEVMKKFIKDGIKLDYFSLKVEEFTRPIKPLQCYNCQKFDHTAVSCPTKDPVCLKCGEKHAIKDCPRVNTNYVLCANCGEDHASSSNKCQIYQLKLQEKMNKMNPETIKSINIANNRKYSQVVNNKENEVNMEKSIVESVKQLLISTENNIKMI
jgi:hypothetical protein